MTVTSTTTTTTSNAKVHPPMTQPAMTQPAGKLSSSYRPRPRPSQPTALTASASGSITPRVGNGVYGDGSLLRNEVKVVNQVALDNANEILRMLALLPAPLPEILPPVYLPTPKTSPKEASFEDFVMGTKRRLPSDELVGLGLTLDSSKRHKIPHDYAGVVAKIGSRRYAEPSKAAWTSAQWLELFHTTSSRAILSKRLADAYGRTPAIKPEFFGVVDPDPKLSLLRFTDSILLFLYSYWCSEQSHGRLQITQYDNSQALRDSTRSAWDRELRRDGITAEEKERTGCMIGLMDLIEAMVANHLSHYQGTQIQKQHRELSVATASHRSSSIQQNGAPRAPIPTMVGRSPHSISPPNAQDSSPSNNSTGSVAVELAHLANALALSNNLATNHLHSSRSRLTPVLMRNHFPRMFTNAITSDFSAEALPPPGDMLGSGRTINVDNTDHFAWPIELGMSAGMAHLVAFGRGMVKEYAESSGYDWHLALG